MIQGYAARDSVAVGESLWLHVSCDSSRFRVDFLRQGETLVRVGGSGWLEGCAATAPTHPDGTRGRADPAVDWAWPGYEFVVTADWKPGIYVAELHEAAASGHRVTIPDRQVFIVRPRYPGTLSPILYKVATFTGHAYNASDRGSSLYEKPVYVAHGVAGRPFGHKVSMRRPGDLRHFAAWDAPFVGWLERNGYDVEFCADLDVHEDPQLLDVYRLVLSVGHDEYWSERMRNGVEAFVRGGGNVAFLGANTCWWRIHLTDENTAFVSDTDHLVGDAFPHLPATDQWWTPKPDGVGRPENSLTGVSFRNGGVWPYWYTDDDRPVLGFTVQHAAHWVYEGTGLRDGSGGGCADVLGAGVALVGYECDGSAYDRDQRGVARANGRDGSPGSFLILGIAVLDPIDADFYAQRPGAWLCTSREVGLVSPRAATMGIYTAGGTVFCAATTNWPVILGQDADANVARITRNVLNRLALRGA